MKFVVILFLTLTISFSVRSQDTGFIAGYVITNAGDTLTGLIKNKNEIPYRVLPNIKFKQAEGLDVTEYSPSQVKEFTIGRKRYLSNSYVRFGKTYKMFMEVIIDDDLMLFEFRETQFGTGGDAVYKLVERKKDGSQYFFSISANDMTFNFKSKMSEFLKDFPVLSEKIKNGTYKKKHIVEIVKEYNIFIKNEN